MDLNTHRAQANGSDYRIEVSGWDSENNFFVEKTALAWKHDAKTAVLQHEVLQGSLVFIRVLGAPAGNTVGSVPHEAIAVDGHAAADGGFEVSLVSTGSYSVREKMPMQTRDAEACHGT